MPFHAYGCDASDPPLYNTEILINESKPQVCLPPRVCTPSCNTTHPYMKLAAAVHEYLHTDAAAAPAIPS